MYLPPLQALQDTQVQVSGDVTIHPSAAIAPGVLLLAAPGSTLVIGAGVCIGMGSVLHACEGQLNLQDGVSLGAGVLIVGSGTIGARACIGSLSTLLNASVDGQVLVPSGSILGDRSRQIQLEAEPLLPAAAPSQNSTPQNSTPQNPPPQDPPPPAASVATVQTPETEAEPVSTFRYPDPPNLNPTVTEPPTPPPAPPVSPTVTVHGQAYVHSLLSTLLPHRSQSQPPPSANP